MQKHHMPVKHNFYLWNPNQNPNRVRADVRQQPQQQPKPNPQPQPHKTIYAFFRLNPNILIFL